MRQSPSAQSWAASGGRRHGPRQQARDLRESSGGESSRVAEGPPKPWKKLTQGIREQIHVRPPGPSSPELSPKSSFSRAVALSAAALAAAALSAAALSAAALSAACSVAFTKAASFLAKAFATAACFAARFASLAAALVAACGFAGAAAGDPRGGGQFSSLSSFSFLFACCSKRRSR